MSVEAARMLRDLAKALEDAEVKARRASEARRSLPAGSSRAKVTTANARWAAACEHRDRCEARLVAAGVDMVRAREAARG